MRYKNVLSKTFIKMNVMLLHTTQINWKEKKEWAAVTMKNSSHIYRMKARNLKMFQKRQKTNDNKRIDTT